MLRANLFAQLSKVGRLEASIRKATPFTSRQWTCVVSAVSGRFQGSCELGTAKVNDITQMGRCHQDGGLKNIISSLWRPSNLWALEVLR